MFHGEMSSVFQNITKNIPLCDVPNISPASTLIAQHAS